MIDSNAIHHRSIREYLKKTGTTERQLAASLGVSQAYVNLLKNGSRRPTPELAQKIESVTGIPFKELLLNAGAPRRRRRSPQNQKPRGGQKS